MGEPSRPAEGRASYETLLFACFAALSGSLDALLLIGWRQIDPSNLRWLKGDPAVYQAGWEFLRRQSWAFPPTWIDRLDYPFGISAAYLDVIPIVAVPLRLFAGMLPQNFQYLGAYAALCLILQTYFALKLLSRFTSDKVIIYLGALFFLYSPILIGRLSGHYSLCSQWLILAALYYYFRPMRGTGLASFLSPFAILLFISGAITPYLAAMALLIALAALLRTALEPPQSAMHQSGCWSNDGAMQGPGAGGRALSVLCHLTATNRLLWGVVLLTSLSLSLVLFGFVTFNSRPNIEGTGYAYFSMNALSPVNPGDCSLYFRSFGVLPGQEYEGYNYLGAGILLLGLLCVVLRPALLGRLWRLSVRPLLFLSLLLIVLALSVRVTFGQTVLFTIPAPHALLRVLSIFQSSGRFFWPVHSLLFLAAIVATTLAIQKPWPRRAALVATFLVQFCDTLPLQHAVATQIRITNSNPLVSRDWAQLSDYAKHLVILPAWQCDPMYTPGGNGAWPWFAWLAGRSGLTLNSVHAARTSAASETLNCADAPKQVARVGLDPKTAYVLNDALAVLVIDRQAPSDYCRRVDGFDLCTFDPVRAPSSRFLGERILPFYVPGTEFRADRAAPNSMLLQGWDLRPFPAVWTVDEQPELFIRPTLPPAGDLRLEMQLAGNGALLSYRHPTQRARVKVDGRTLGVWTFKFQGSNLFRSLVIPRRFIHQGQIMEISFELPDAISPSALGINGDGRLLGLYVSRIRLVGAS